MNFDDFRLATSKLPVIKTNHLKVLFRYNQTIKMQLLRWTKAKKLVRLRKDIYMLNEHDRRMAVSRQFLAQEIYMPSYISMEYALAYHGLIPEKSEDITCITTRKKKNFTNDTGTYRYLHVKTSCFTGYREHKDENGLQYFLALPEKALVDFLYLNRNTIKGDMRQQLRESFRLQNLDILKRSRLRGYCLLFNNKKLNALIAAVEELSND